MPVIFCSAPAPCSKRHYRSAAALPYAAQARTLKFSGERPWMCLKRRLKWKASR